MHSCKESRNQHRQHDIIMGKVLRFLSNTTVQLTDIEALYHGVQALMAGSISHFILPHDRLAIALDHVQQHLAQNQPHMTLSHRDFGFYYNQADFKTFRRDNILFLVVEVPITTEGLAHSFRSN